MKALELLCTAPMDNPIGSCTYSLMLNEAGGIEADITVTRISEDAFYIVTGAAFTHYLIERVRTLLSRKKVEKSPPLSMSTSVDFALLS